MSFAKPTKKSLREALREAQRGKHGSPTPEVGYSFVEVPSSPAPQAPPSAQHSPALHNQVNSVAASPLGLGSPILGSDKLRSPPQVQEPTTLRQRLHRVSVAEHHYASPEAARQHGSHGSLSRSGSIESGGAEAAHARASSPSAASAAAAATASAAAMSASAAVGSPDSAARATNLQSAAKRTTKAASPGSPGLAAGTPVGSARGVATSSALSPNWALASTLVEETRAELCRALNDERTKREHDHSVLRGEVTRRKKVEAEAEDLRSQLKVSKKQQLPSTRLMELMERLNAEQVTKYYTKNLLTGVMVWLRVRTSFDRLRTLTSKRASLQRLRLRYCAGRMKTRCHDLFSWWRTEVAQLSVVRSRVARARLTWSARRMSLVFSSVAAYSLACRLLRQRLASYSSHRDRSLLRLLFHGYRYVLLFAPQPFHLNCLPSTTNKVLFTIMGTGTTSAPTWTPSVSCSLWLWTASVASTQSLLQC